MIAPVALAALSYNCGDRWNNHLGRYMGCLYAHVEQSAGSDVPVDQSDAGDYTIEPQRIEAILTVHLPTDWRERCISWADRTDAVRELWLFGSRGPKGGARTDSDIDLGLVMMPKIGNHDWAVGNYAALVGQWRADLEAILERHVSLVPMIEGNDGNAHVRTTGECLWRRRP